MSEASGTVQLAEQRSASAVLHAALLEVATAFSAELSAAQLPTDPGAFRRGYPELLPRFEAVRVASDARYRIAAAAVAALRPHLHWQEECGGRPLHEALHDRRAPLELRTRAFDGAPGWRPGLVYRGSRWDADRLGELGHEMKSRGVLTTAACAALGWVGENLLEDGVLRLSGRRIAVLGGGAEMAPTRFWLEAGADVLWLDRVPPPEHWFREPDLAGRLHWPANGVDLLTQPREVLATLEQFAGGGPLDVGLYAYAPGQARELLLTGTMNALVDALPPELLASVTMLVSPTTPTALGADDLAAMEARRESRPGWEGMLAGLGLLGRGGGAVRHGSGAATRSVVAIQGGSYQAAQYLGKVLVAERWAALARSDGERPMRISANTAAITRTRSLDHPVFAAAFGGAAAFGVETLAPRQSRRLNGLLALHDWLHPEEPIPGAIRVHGGIHTLPYPLGSALRVAATIGFMRSPRLLRGLISR